MSTSMVHTLCQRLTCNDPTLKTLTLSHRDVLRSDNNNNAANDDEKKITALAEALSNNTTVTHVIINNRGNADALIMAILKALQVNTTVTSLDLRNNALGIEGAKALQDLLRINKDLKTLYLARNDFADVGTCLIVDGLLAAAAASSDSSSSSSSSAVEEIDLSGNNIGNVGACALGVMLGMHNCRMKKLQLAFNNIGDVGAQGLVQGLVNNNNNNNRSMLETLLLMCNKIDIPGVKAFVQMLASTNQRIKTLYLSSIHPLDDATKHELIEVLQHNNYYLQDVLFGPYDHTLQAKLGYYCRLNKAGRALLRAEPNERRNASLWANLLTNVSNDPDSLYYFIQSKPELFMDLNQEEEEEETRGTKRPRDACASAGDSR